MIRGGGEGVGARFIAPCLFSRGGAEKTGGWRCCAAYPPCGCRFCSALAGLDNGAVCLRRFRARYAHAPPTVTHVARLRRCLGCERKACHRGHDETLVWIPMPLKGGGLQVPSPCHSRESGNPVHDKGWGRGRRGAIYRALFGLTRRRGERGEKRSAGRFAHFSPAFLPHKKARRCKANLFNRKEKTGVIASEAKQSRKCAQRKNRWIASLRSQ